MAKLSVYNTIDRSQLGGKFVPLIQSGVSNYKILASDLGKEYHPGDAIEITDTGEINVNYDHNALKLSGSKLCVKTDYDRGVFIGSDGIYIASADSTINVGLSGISVNRSDLVSRISGAGLKAVGEMIDVNPADDTIDVGMEGIRVNTSALSIPNAHSLAGSGLESVDSNTLYVKSANGTINVSSLGIKVNTSFLAGRYLRADSNHGITVDTASVARAITGSGLVTTNGAIGVNVNTATGIIVNDNKLYLNAGAGLHTTNNTVKVKAADDTINVSSSGIKVNRSALSIPTAYSLAGDGLIADANGGTSVHVQSADKSIGVSSAGIKVNAGYGLETTSSGLYVKSADNTINVSSSGIKVNVDALSIPDELMLAGQGLIAVGRSLYVKSADSSIDVSHSGIKVTGYGLSATDYGLAVKAANKSIGVYNDGIEVNLGSGMRMHADGIMVGELDASIGVEREGIRVRKDNNTLKLRNNGLYVDTAYVSGAIAGDGLTSKEGRLYVKSVDDSIGISGHGISVNAGYGLETTSSGLSVKAADGTVRVNSSGLSIYYGSGLRRANEDNGKLSVHIGPGLKFSSTGAIEAITASSLVDGGTNIKSENYTGYLYASATGLAGYGLKASNYEDTVLSVKVADDSVDLSSEGIKVNTGYGLETTSSGLYVKSADNTINVSSAGIKVNKSALSIPTTSSLAGQGLKVGPESSLYVQSADGTISVGSSGISVYYGSGLRRDTDNNGQLSVYLGSGLYFDSLGAICTRSSGVRVGAGLAKDGETIYIRSSDNTILASDMDLKVWTDTLAGVGLGHSYSELYVLSADDTISVSADGIKVNKSALSIPTTSSLAGQGLQVGPESSLYVKSADNTINVSSAGISVNKSALSIPTASALAGHGLVSNPEGKLDINYGPGLAIDTTSSMVYVDYGSGLGVDSSGKLYVTSSSTQDIGKGLWLASDNNDLLSVYAGSGLGFSSRGNRLEVKTVDNTISVTSDGIKVAEGFWSPDYSSAVTANQDTEYTADTNCWLYMNVANSGTSSGSYIMKSIVIDGITVADLSATYWVNISIMVPCKKGSTYQFKNRNTGVGGYTFKVYKCLE